VVAVWTTPEGREAVTSTTVSAAGVSFPDPGAARPVAARITVHTPDLAAVTRIEDLYLRRRIRVLSIPATPPSRLPPA
jgi:hypothetical protein